VQGPAHATGRTLGVELLGERVRARVQLTHAVELGPGGVVGRDPREVGVGELGARDPSGRQRRLELGDRRVLQVDPAQRAQALRGRGGRGGEQERAGERERKAPHASSNAPVRRDLRANALRPLG
jgi:hypothetical protein